MAMNESEEGEIFDVNGRHGIPWGGTYSRNEKLNYTVDDLQDGDSVTLKINGVAVEVRNIVLGEDYITGIIYSFGPDYALTFRDLSIDQQVKFNKENVFGATTGTR